MSQYANLKAAIAANVYQNHNNEVTANMVKAAMNAMTDSLGAGYQYLGIATPATTPGTPDQRVFYIAAQPGTYTNFSGLVVNDGEVAVLKWDTAWHKEVTGAATAAQVTELGQELYGELIVFKDDIDRSGHIRKDAGGAAALPFVLKSGTYNVSVDDLTFITSLSLYFYDSEGNNVLGTGVSIGVLIARGLTLPSDVVKIGLHGEASASGTLIIEFDSVENVGLKKKVEDIENKVTEVTDEVTVINNELYSIVGNVSDILIEQGGYNTGVPVSDSKRLRINRMILATELPLTITIPDECDVRLYKYNLYATANDYTSYISIGNIQPANYKKLVIDSSFIGDNAGVTVDFARASDLSANVTPKDAFGTTFKYSEGIDIPAIENILGTGNADYYGSPITIPITERSYKMTSERLLTHTPSIYSHTKYNQSMAAYNGKFFCFNDTRKNDGFCVVIDMITKNVIDFVDTIPTQITNAHVNNVCFTDVFYAADDAYPLILISRGDYPNNDSRCKEMYIFRITESNGEFTFTHIKTIATAHYYFTPSWEYDANRKMIWGHVCEHGDWRWGNAKYRKFNNYAMYFAADPGTEYFCIGTSENAAVDADITITSYGNEVKIVSVQSGSPLSPEDTVRPYNQLSYGYTSIRLNQSADAFTGQYTVYSCDANGQNRKPINLECLICGFKAPSLTDSTAVTIADSELQKVKIDPCIFQGGCCYAGKLFIDASGFATINGVPNSFVGQSCVVVDPESGAIESLIPTDNLENQGCTILDGALYISSHDGDAEETQDSFRITKYTF